MLDRESLLKRNQRIIDIVMKQIDDTTMIISRGIGNSAFPFRLFNRPEVLIIEFEFLYP